MTILSAPSRLKRAFTWTGQRLGGAASALRRHWRALSPLSRQFASNMLVAMLVLVTLHVFQSHPLLMRQQSAGLDWLMRMTANTGTAEHATPYLFIDLDTPSWQTLGEPLSAPADTLALVLGRLIDTQARQVVVDFDFSRRSLRDLAPLAAMLARWQATEHAPPLTLMRTLSPPRAPDHYGVPRDTVLDDLLQDLPEHGSSSPAVWAAPFFSLDADHRVRRWRLVEIVCQGEHTALLPSVQLVSLARRHGQLAALDTQLAAWPGASCDDSRQPALPTLTLGGQTLQLADGMLAERILYTLPAQPDDGWFRHAHLGQQTPFLIRVPVQSLLGGLLGDTAPLGDHLTQARTVVIGASHVESGDLHVTPLGEMPGPLILINAMHSLERFGQISPPAWWRTVLVTTLLVLVMSACLVYLPPLAANVLPVVVVAVLIVPLSMLWFRSGVWLDFALPLFAVAVFRWLHRFRRLRARHTQRRGSHDPAA
ncbi:MAG: CHASE2 domain-containing protein [Alcanivorax sp.]|nr:CHASE2 domain-containing protein [Alcanivorax sp.]